MVQYGQTAPVRHAQSDFIHVLVDASVNDGFKSDVEWFHAFDAKPLRRGELFPELLFETSDFLQPFQQLQLAYCGLIVFPVEERFCFLAHPDQAVVLHDMTDLPADCAALGIIQKLHYLP